MEKDVRPLASTPEFNEAANDLVTATLDMLPYDRTTDSIDIIVHYDRRTNAKSARIELHQVITKEVD